MNRSTTISPGISAAMRVGRELLTAGWVYDGNTPMTDGTVERLLLHPAGRQIVVTSRDGDSHDLTMTGLSLEDVADAITAAGLTTTAEAAQGAPGEPAGPQTLQHKLAAELIHLAHAVVRLDLPLGRCMNLGIGVLDNRADLDRWAEHLGSTVEVDSNGIPHTTHSTPLPEGPYGASLNVTAQAPKDTRSEVERLRARVAELEAQQSTGGAR
ncbi:hypothetical protein E0H26_11560 [Micromonospora zingiberis]|uniref:Uncharacterized protein n=1 Tax=Micromonospora zingiberis TaxID=2053011 RepID=A0A4R0GJC7_9ACTN|nr:hypothetical protein [Micromonospora zingiberis]TCB97550.1 hypothetical protein E0H26_11560 [Micromonospora zingiberis]